MEAPSNPLGEGITGPLARTRPWVKFVAIMGFIAAGFALMGALPMLTFSRFIPVPRESALVSHGLFILMGLLYVFVAALYISCLRSCSFATPPRLTVSSATAGRSGSPGRWNSSAGSGNKSAST